MLNNSQIYLLVIVSVVIVILCLCDNRRPETFCNISESHNIMSQQEGVQQNVIIGVLDESVKHMSRINMLSSPECDINMNITTTHNFGKMKANAEPDFPDYAKL